jgi:hypothetical protein
VRHAITLRERPIDWILLGLSVINLGFITCIVDVEHWWGNNFDPLQNARPPWWRATIWVPAIFWSGVMFANVSIIMFEEPFGPHATPARGIVMLANFPWWLLPFFVTWRFLGEHPFSREVPTR